MAGSIHGLYVIIDPDACSGRAVADVARDALAGGASVLQWRDKQRPLGDQLDDALAIAALCSEYGALFIVNDHVDFALACDADGVHLGQHDLPIERVRPIVGDELIIGVSTNNAQEALRAEALGADYVAIGAIFPTSSKLDTRPANLARLSEIKHAVQIPVIAIGGINATNISDVIASGADAVAVISAVCAASDVMAAATEMAAAFDQPLSKAPCRTTMLLLVDAYVSAVNRRDMAAFLDLFAEDGLLEDSRGDPPHVGREAIALWWARTGLDHRPFSIDVRNVAVVEQEMALVWSIQHKHDGHEPARASGVEIISVEENGRIASVHSLWNRPDVEPETDAERVANAFTTAINTRDRKAYLDLWSNDGMRQDPAAPSPLIGIEAITAAFDIMLAAYPDYTMGIDDICAAGSEAAIVWSTIERQGEVSRTVRGVDVLTLDETGKIGALHSYWEPNNLPQFE